MQNTVELEVKTMDIIQLWKRNSIHECSFQIPEAVATFAAVVFAAF